MKNKFKNTCGSVHFNKEKITLGKTRQNKRLCNSKNITSILHSLAVNNIYMCLII